MIISKDTQVLGSVLKYRKSLLPGGDEPECTSAAYFTFDGDSITGYTGSDSEIVLPRSYSKSEIITTAPGTKAYIQPYSSWGTYINSTRWNYLTYISFTDGTKTVKYERNQYTIDQFKSQIQIDFPDYSKVYLDSIKTTASSTSYNVRNFFSQSTNYNMFKYPLSLNWNGVTHTWQDYSATPEDVSGGRTLSSWFQNEYRYDSNIGQKDLIGGGAIITTYNYFDGDDYQVSHIARSAFSNNQIITKIISLDNIISMDTYAFNLCTNLETISFSNSLSFISSSAFRECISLKNITIPGSVTRIGSGAFQGCTKLSNVTFGEGNNDLYIEYQAFYGCISLISMQLPDNLYYLGYEIFNGCSNLENLTIKPTSNLQIISHHCFYNMPKLTSIYIPSKVEASVDDDLESDNNLAGLFSYCSSLSSIIVDPYNPQLTSTINNQNCNAILSKDGTIFYDGCKDSIIPSGVTTIYYSAFNACENLTNITIPEGVSIIKDYAFKDCRKLKNITIPSSITNIGKDAFIATYVSEGHLDYIKILAIIPPIISANYPFPLDHSIYVPDDSVNAYKTATVWSDWYSKVIKSLSEFPDVIPPIYGVSWLNDESTTMTRTGDAVNMTYSISNGKVTSDFDNVFPYNQMKRTTIDGNVFVYVPSMWFKVTTDNNYRITAVSVSETSGFGTGWYKTKAFYYGAYGASGDNGNWESTANNTILKSIPNASRVYSTHKDVCRTLCMNVGTGYHQRDLYMSTILMFLWWIEWATKDTRNIMTGHSLPNASYTDILPTGGTDSFYNETEGNTFCVSGYNTSNNQMVWHGIEDYIGNLYEWEDGYTGTVTGNGQGNNNLYASSDYIKYDEYDWDNQYTKMSLLSYDNIIPTGPSKCIKSFAWDSYNPFLVVPREVLTDGTYSTGFCASCVDIRSTALISGIGSSSAGSFGPPHALTTYAVYQPVTFAGSRLVLEV